MKVLSVLFLLSLLCSCSMLNLGIGDVSGTTEGLLLVVNNDIYPQISSAIAQYITDLDSDGTTVNLELWSGNNAEELREFIQHYSDETDAAFLVGDLPSAWYEQTAFGSYESFPCDLFYMSKNTDWFDYDNNGIYDNHSELDVSIYTSRVIGTAEQLNNYFQKVHLYRITPYIQDGSAYIFKDDDWISYKYGSDFNLGRIFPDVQINESETTTILSSYCQDLLPPRINYVYQWIHATPYSLHINNQDSYEIIRTYDITPQMTGMFYNLFDCSAARFTQNNLGMSYLMNTDTALAVLGSTKVGGNYYPAEFHRVLSLGGTWGEAYKDWYNKFGVYDDTWFLGMVILGDPTLAVAEKPIQDAAASISSARNVFPPDETEKENMFMNLLEFQKTVPAE